jgi:hypothetical protein
MARKKKEVRLYKIPVSVLLETLKDIYEMGVNYIDIVGIPDEQQDTIGIMFSEEYMSEEAREKHEKFKEDIIKEMEEELNEDEEEEKPNIENKINIKLSDDDLNQLL